jgi:hypothetical protein
MHARVVLRATITPPGNDNAGENLLAMDVVQHADAPAFNATTIDYVE